MNITYLFGAGASAKACPILKGQGEEMIKLSKKHISDDFIKMGLKPINPNAYNRILYDIGYFGEKALEYGTIDIYAKKLYLSDDYENELDRLKLSVSHFFTIWESMDDDLKKNGKYENIDPRYIGLLASVLEKTPDRHPKIKDNLKFITWNYDLQFERAYKSLCMSHLDWDNISKLLRFRINDKNVDTLDICHLNGYSGYYFTDKANRDTGVEVDTVNRNIQNMDVQSIVKALEFTAESQNRSQLTFNKHINYAWESNELATTARNIALNIFESTDILVIIGYSFPPFNKEIDQLLFSKLSKRKTKIIYQDPNASEDYISILVKGFDTDIYCINDKLDHFFLPYEF